MGPEISGTSPCGVLDVRFYVKGDGVATRGRFGINTRQKAVLAVPGHGGRPDSLAVMHPGGAGFAGRKPGPDARPGLPATKDPISTLTRREAEVLGRIVAGQNTKKMALEMNVTTETLRTYVRNVLAKLSAHSRLEAAAIASKPVPPEHHEPDLDHPLFAALTPREREILLHLTKGFAQPEVAKRLHMSAKTVSAHLHNLRSKLGVHSTLEAVALARSWLHQRAAHQDPAGRDGANYASPSTFPA
jgi:DNA-binding NarL/FixJ family response regulator